MKKDTLEAKKTKKQPYVKPTIEVMHLPEDLCLVSVSQQKPPMETYSGSQDDEDDVQENALWKSQQSVWDK